MNVCPFVLSCFRAFCILLSAFLPLASFAQTLPDEIFGEYLGDVRVTSTTLGIDQTMQDITVELENRNSENDYFITIPDLEMMGIEFPVELDKVIITPFAGGYKLSRTESISFVIEDVSIPAIPPYIPAGVYDITFEIILENSEIAENALSLNLKVMASLIYYIGPIGIPISIPFNIAFNGLHEVPPPPPPPVITTTNLPSGIENQAYNALLEATGETPITWSIIAGNLPTGITLDPITGSISGIPTEANTFNFTVQAENIGGAVSQLLSIVIEEEDTVGIKTPKFEAFKIYPNPTTSELRVESGELKVNSVEVFDIYGKKLSQLSTFNSQLSTQINVSQLPAGVYIIKIQSDKGVYKQQFIKK